MSPLPSLSSLTFRERYLLEFASRRVAEKGCVVITSSGDEFAISPGLHATLIAGVLADFVRIGGMSSAAAAPIQAGELEARHV